MKDYHMTEMPAPPDPSRRVLGWYVFWSYVVGWLGYRVLGFLDPTLGPELSFMLWLTSPFTWWMPWCFCLFELVALGCKHVAPLIF